MPTCINCRKPYKTTFIANYNLDLCKKCLEKLEPLITTDYFVSRTTITCPKCKKKYNESIIDEKCRTKGCNIHFFRVDGDIFARWIDLPAHHKRTVK